MYCCPEICTEPEELSVATKEPEVGLAAASNLWSKLERVLPVRCRGRCGGVHIVIVSILCCTREY